MPRRSRVVREGEATVWVIHLKGEPYLVLRWIDQDTGLMRQQSSGCTTRRDAERQAAMLAQRIENGIIDRETGWQHFRERYEREKLSGCAAGTQKQWATSANRYEAAVDPQSIQQAADPRRLSRFIGNLRAEGLSEATIGAYVAYLKAAFNWAVGLRMINHVPRLRAPGHGKRDRHMRGRPLTPAEFRVLLRTVRQVRPHDWRLWVRLLRGLWLSGLRLSEAIALSWDPGSAFAVDLTGRHPAFRIRGIAQKSGKDEVLPMTPDFAKWLLRAPAADRHGPVFPVPGAAGQMNLKRVGRSISAMGVAAGIVVNADQGKHASAHDLRRSFGTRWAKQVMPAVLQRLMRHSSIETTMRYYVSTSADELAADLWRRTENVTLPVTLAPNADAAG